MQFTQYNYLLGYIPLATATKFTTFLTDWKSRCRSKNDYIPKLVLKYNCKELKSMDIFRYA